MQILFEHPWFLIVNKPTDLLSQAIDGIDSVQTKLIALLKSETPNDPNPFVGIPHRLDRVTTGVMVIARNKRSLSLICGQFASRRVTKIYHAVVQDAGPNSAEIDSVETSASAVECLGPHAADGNTRSKWEDWLRKIPDVAKAEICSPDVEGARQAILYQRSLQDCFLDGDRNGPPLSLFELELETGRMHQIRLQCARRGFPILGDSLYGSSLSWQEGDFRQSPIALHARSISFHHPQTAELLHFEAPYPESWKRFGL